MNTKILMSLIVVICSSIGYCASVEVVYEPQDDCSFIREQLHAMDEFKGGTIHIPEGRFYCKSPIIIKKSNVAIVGAGEDKTTLLVAPDLFIPLIVVGDTKIVEKPYQQKDGSFRKEALPDHYVYNASVSNLTLDGNIRVHRTSKVDGSFETSLTMNGVPLDMDEPHKHECYHHQTGNSAPCDNDSESLRNNGITIRGAENIAIDHVTARGMASGGLVTEKDCTKLSVTNFTSEHNYYDGLAGYMTKNSVFKNLVFRKNKGAGFSLDIEFSFNHLSDVQIQSADVAIFGIHIEGNEFKNINIIESGNYGVFLGTDEKDKTGWTCPRDNTFDHLVFQKSRGAFFVLNRDCKGNAVQNSEFKKLLPLRGKIEKSPIINTPIPDLVASRNNKVLKETEEFIKSYRQ